MLSQISRSFTSQPDLLVIGGGPGGYVASIRAAQLGLKTMCVEKNPILGGTCLREGCIPSKFLLNMAHKVHDIKSVAPSLGIEIKSDISVNLETVHRRKNATISGLSGGIKSLFKKYGVEYYQGTANIEDSETVIVKQGSKIMTANPKHLLIASGSEAITPKMFGVDEKTIVTSRGALSFKEVPKRLVVIGGGVIGLELGTVWNSLGSKVVIIDQLPTIGGPALEREASNTLMQAMKRNKMEFILGKSVKSVEKLANGGATVTVGDQKIECDKVLVSIGRRPMLEGFGFEKLGVAMNGPLVAVDSKFQTSVKNVYAIGDIIHGPMLAHKASHDGIACVEQIAGLKSHVNYNAVPSVIYTTPEVATVGLTEAEAKKQGRVKIGKFPYMANSRARAVLETSGYVKWVCKDDGTVLGLTIVGPNASEAIMEGVIAVENGLNIKAIANTVHPHPTFSESLMEAAKAVLGKPVHF